MKTKYIYLKTIQFGLVVLMLFLTACLDTQTVRKRSTKIATPSTESDSTPVDGNAAGPGEGGDGSVASTLDGILENGEAELRHIVDPTDGTYKTKVTIPKNFTGLLYLSGLNITSLASKLVYARFNFGRDLEPVTIQATIGRAPGITPQTDIEVVILDINDKPFEDIRLLYDLFDYNDYDSDNDGTEEGTPVSDARDGYLYCRGLKLEHDPTFQSSLTNTACDGLDGDGNSTDEKCLYAYAKIKDSGLYDSNSLALIPSTPQIDIGGSGYTSDSETYAVTKCLPDSNNSSQLQAVLNATSITGAATLAGGETVTMPSAATYTYNGPYRALSQTSWEISAGSLFSDMTVGGTTPMGLFQKSYDIGNYDPDGGYRSFLFPRSGTMSLSAGVQHFSLTDPFPTMGSPDTPRTLTSLVSSGDSNYVDGCNIRMLEYDSSSNEGISSCNVTATIELLTIDAATNKETILTSSSKVKLQLIRPSETDYMGREVLYTSMKTCINSQSCGATECCFNSRCWSKELVAQCLEDASIVGNNGIGESCTSDFQCSSFCCNSSTGVCAVHLNTQDEQVLCSKAPGQTCVAREWCRKENVQHCYIVKTSKTAQGQQECALRCYNVPTYGDCRDGYCFPPVPPAVPEFDSSNPDCTEAIDPPTNVESSS